MSIFLQIHSKRHKFNVILKKLIKKLKNNKSDHNQHY